MYFEFKLCQKKAPLRKVGEANLLFLPPHIQETMFPLLKLSLCVVAAVQMRSWAPEMTRRGNKKKGAAWLHHWNRNMIPLQLQKARRWLVFTHFFLKRRNTFLPTIHSDRTKNPFFHSWIAGAIKKMYILRTGKYCECLFTESFFTPFASQVCVGGGQKISMWNLFHAQ